MEKAEGLLPFNDQIIWLEFNFVLQLFHSPNEVCFTEKSKTEIYVDWNSDLSLCIRHVRICGEIIDMFGWPLQWYFVDVAYSVSVKSVE